MPRDNRRAVDAYLASPAHNYPPPARQEPVVAPVIDRLVDELERERELTRRWRLIALDLYAPHTCPEHSRGLVTVETCHRCRGEGAFLFEHRWGKP